MHVIRTFPKKKSYKSGYSAVIPFNLDKDETENLPHRHGTLVCFVLLNTIEIRKVKKLAFKDKFIHTDYFTFFL